MDNDGRLSAMKCLRDFECSWPAVNSTPRKRRSRLMPSLDEALRDRNARRHFQEFLSTTGDTTAVNQLQFWLDADSFRAVTLARLAGRHSSYRCSETTRKNEDLVGGRSSAVTNCIETGSHVSTEDGGVPKCSLPLSRHLDGGVSNDKQLAHKLWRSIERDAVSTFTTYIAKDASHPIALPDDLRDEVTHRICDVNGRVEPRCFEPAQAFVVASLAGSDDRHFRDFLHSVHHFKHQVEVLTGGAVVLEDILYNEPSLFFFTEFVELEKQRDLLEFWLAADNFYEHLMEVGGEGHYDGLRAQEDAMVLYDRYFSLQATSPLGFSDAVRLQVEQNICREEGPTPTCFERAVGIVLAVLQRIYFESFLASQLYVKYLNELVNAVRTTTATCAEERQQEQLFRRPAAAATLRRRSDGGTDSDGIRNTLLAMDSTPRTAAAASGASPASSRRATTTTMRRTKFDGGDMRIDTGQFVPDALWRRKHAGKLTIGHVNEVGQFVSDLEPEPDKRSTAAEWMLPKAVKRLVNREEDKAERDMAVQVARMIIHEVISVTLARKDVEDGRGGGGHS